MKEFLMKQKKETETKLKNSQKRLEKRVEKRMGRIDMTRTKPLQIKKVEVKTDDLDEEQM